MACARCGELIAPDDKWDLDHKDNRQGWLGPSHRACNRHHGWERMVDVTSGNGHRIGLAQEPLRWSQKWFDDPPVGTVKVGTRPWEVHVGNGVWVEIDEVPV